MVYFPWHVETAVEIYGKWQHANNPYICIQAKPTSFTEAAHIGCFQSEKDKKENHIISH